MKKIYQSLIAAAIFISAIVFMVYSLGNMCPDSHPLSREEIQERVPFFALRLYQEKKLQSMQFNSQCLGVIEVPNDDCDNSDYEYAVDIVHVPRTQEDNLAENQCEAYRNKSVSHFIELDKEGNVVRIV